MVEADRGQLEQVLVNIDLNAWRAMPHGGDLNVYAYFDKTSAVHEEQPDSGSINIEVRDNGKGIPEEKIDRIFYPFYTSKSDGVGLGLSISLRLLEENKPADVLTVGQELEQLGQLAEAGGAEYLVTLANNTPSAANIVSYAEIVRERAMLRRLIAGNIMTDSR